MRYEFHPEALAEYHDATHYFLERQPGLELRFIEEIEHAIHQILESPRQWRVFEDDVRRYLTHVFPYAILYTIESNYVLIIAVMHCSRKPGYWRHRTQETDS
jgi:plasmid stabilization system protein ParE